MPSGHRLPTLEERTRQRGGAVDETFRMLGREHEADLEREAQKRRLAALARTAPNPHRVRRPSRRRSRLAFFARPKEA
jgi:hypothetical protein